MSVGCGGYGFARRFIQSQMPARGARDSNPDRPDCVCIEGENDI